MGEVALEPGPAHHILNVLRLADGTEIEIFDDAGNVATGVLRLRGSGRAAVVVERVAPPVTGGLRWTVASAVPKGERADWMVEKLSELGTAAFVPLATARSVVLPEGKNKRDRWARIAAESATQSRRRGVMRIEPLTPLADAIAGMARGASHNWFLSPAPDGTAITRALRDGTGGGRPADVTLLVGPEGGWTGEEIAAMRDAGLLAVRLTETILRVETAAVAAAAVIGAWAAG